MARGRSNTGSGYTVTMIHGLTAAQVQGLMGGQNIGATITGGSLSGRNRAPRGGARQPTQVRRGRKPATKTT